MGINATNSTLISETIPLQRDAQGIMRVGNTRVTLDTVLAAFKEGATAEEIVQQYPSLSLADVYYTIGYYLRRQSEVEVYLDQRRKGCAKVQQQNEIRSDPIGIRQRLLARRARGDSD